MSDKFRFSLSPSAALFYSLLTLCAEDWELLSLLSAVVFHELGHVLALLCCGGHIRGAALELGGLRLEAGLPAEGWKEALCALAGPGAGLLWSVLAAGAGGERWIYAAGLSALLSLFNLLPCLPLDGGRALLSLTGSEALLRWNGAASVGVLLGLGLRWKLYFSLIPALWLLWQQCPLWQR